MIDSRQLNDQAHRDAVLEERGRQLELAAQREAERKAKNEAAIWKLIEQRNTNIAASEHAAEGMGDPEGRAQQQREVLQEREAQRSPNADHGALRHSRAQKMMREREQNLELAAKKRAESRAQKQTRIRGLIEERNVNVAIGLAEASDEVEFLQDRQQEFLKARADNRLQNEREIAKQRALRHSRAEELLREREINLMAEASMSEAERAHQSSTVTSANRSRRCPSLFYVDDAWCTC